MSHAEPLQKKGDYYTIHEGTFRLPTTESDREAVAREWKSPKGDRSGTKYERVFKAIFGKIENVEFKENQSSDGSKFRTVNIVMDENEDGERAIISLGADSRYANDFLSRLPSLDLTKEVRLMPYDFDTEDGKHKTGISINQRDDNGEFTVKVQNFFSKQEGEKWISTNGYPTPTAEDMEDWAFFYKKVSKFLTSYAKENVLQSFSAKTVAVEYPSDEIDASQIPF